MTPEKYNFSLTVAGVCFIAIFALVIIVIALSFLGCARQPTVFILREYTQETDRGPCLVVDYTIGGVTSCAYFYDSEIGLYDRWMDELIKDGRVVR